METMPSRPAFQELRLLYETFANSLRKRLARQERKLGQDMTGRGFGGRAGKA
jgi:hypothetical protein